MALAILGAFQIMAFLVLGRALRESFYLISFPVESLPYITAGIAVLSMPTVAAFTFLLGRNPPQKVLALSVITVGVGLILLWPFTGRSHFAIILFYIWTALGTLLLTSGFWVVTAETFAVRGAKRLFGLIGAGGTAGALLMGVSLNWLTRWLETTWLIGLLIALLSTFFLTQLLWPKHGSYASTGSESTPASESSMRSNFDLVWRNSYLRTIAALVFFAAVISTLLDYQFKELARTGTESQGELAGFLGAFYGWTGGIALILQLLIASRLIARAGVAGGLAVLPIALILGASIFLAAPGLLMITLVKGADISFRRSIGRTVFEFLYVPLPENLRRRTKTIIDSVVDSMAGGSGALLIFLWVTLSHLPSRYLSLYVIGFSFLFLWLSRRMGAQYFRNIVSQLKEKDEDSPELQKEGPSERKDLLSAAFTHLDFGGLTMLTGFSLLESDAAVDLQDDRKISRQTSEAVPDTRVMLQAPDSALVLQALPMVESWDEEHIKLLIRLLARDSLYKPVADYLVRIGADAVPLLAESLRSENTDFVIRRRIPSVLTSAAGPEADDTLLDALSANRFEIRYRAAIALVRRRRVHKDQSRRPWRDRVWQAIRAEVARDRPVWELQKLLDGFDVPDDELIAQHVGLRGALSLEHTFRMLTLVLDPEPVRAAFHGIILEDENLKSYSLEYLDQALPVDIRRRIWLFIGDMSEYKQKKALRPLGEVASDLMATRATLFAEAEARDALKKMLQKRQE